LEHPKTFTKPLNIRDSDMVKMYKEGKTQAEIGARYLIGPRAVSAIFKRIGISREGNGAMARKRAKDQIRKAVQALRIRETWGMSMEEYRSHVDEYGHSGKRGSPMYGYIHQRKDAGYRGIEWHFTFTTWWAMWQASGKWDDRGTGQYSMGRTGDASTPFSPATCKITTVSQIITGDFFSRDHAGIKKAKKND
jgi:hypothetical protein